MQKQGRFIEKYTFFPKIDLISVRVDLRKSTCRRNGPFSRKSGLQLYGSKSARVHGRACEWTYAWMSKCTSGQASVRVEVRVHERGHKWVYESVRQLVCTGLGFHTRRNKVELLKSMPACFLQTSGLFLCVWTGARPYFCTCGTGQVHLHRNKIPGQTSLFTTA